MNYFRIFIFSTSRFLVLLVMTREKFVVQGILLPVIPVSVSINSIGFSGTDND